MRFSASTVLLNFMLHVCDLSLGTAVNNIADYCLFKEMVSLCEITRLLSNVYENDIDTIAIIPTCSTEYFLIKTFYLNI